MGYRAIENVATVYDLWATILHQLAIDHEKLTYRWSGRDMRLTDVHGKVWKGLIAQITNKHRNRWRLSVFRGRKPFAI
ncbi:MAG: DUF1501 domain-containing protein [Akkermansiaceae bacterium]|nr:DUF1501 domain-containing protein [Akkermansiaceae bacterium]